MKFLTIIGEVVRIDKSKGGANVTKIIHHKSLFAICAWPLISVQRFNHYHRLYFLKSVQRESTLGGHKHESTILKHKYKFANPYAKNAYLKILAYWD